MRERLAALWGMVAPEGGWLYRDAHYLAVDVEIDRAAARRWAPWPLAVPERAVATVFTAWFPSNSFGSEYREAGVLLHVEHRGRPVVHCPWMIVDDDVALVLGRELLGYPKKLGRIDFAIEGERIEARAARRGAPLIAMRGALGARMQRPPPILGQPHRNVRASLGVAVPWLIAFTPDERVIEVREVDLTLEMGGSERDPLHELGLTSGAHPGRLHRVDLGRGTLPHPVAMVSPLAHARSMLVRVR